jgi:hypothetical protein
MVSKEVKLGQQEKPVILVVPEADATNLKRMAGRKKGRTFTNRALAQAVINKYYHDTDTPKTIRLEVEKIRESSSIIMWKLSLEPETPEEVVETETQVQLLLPRMITYWLKQMKP